ncbi:MAG: ABC transporter permease [Micrococcales bacterium]|nr:ABC transporter permease [Micrococcales bacterium]
MFAREFADGTITGLFALPVGRGQIALAKLIVYGLWATGVSVALAASLLVLGTLLGYGAPDADALTGLGRQVGLGVLTAAIVTPAAWVATAARSLLAGVGAAIALVVITQVGVLAGAGAWMPPAAPAVWAMSGGVAAGPGPLGLAVVFALVFAALAARSWVRLQLNR